MKFLKIKEIGKVVSGATPKTGIQEYWNGSIPWVTPKEINRLNSQYLNETERKITDSGFKSCSATMLPKGSILFTSRAPIGLVAITNINTCTNQGFKSIILKENIYPLYIYYTLKNYVRELNDLGTGTTFKELSKTKFENFKIPIPTLPDQIRIASILSSVETIIKQRKESITLLDEFLKSMFLDTFGDPFLNPMRHKIVGLEQIVTSEKNAIVDGPFGSSLREVDYIEKGIPIIRINNIRDEGFYNSAFKYIREEKYSELIRSMVKNNDLLIARVGNTIGKSCIFNQKYKALLSTTGVVKATIDVEKANIKFISIQFRLPQYIKYIWDQTEGGGQPYLNLKKIKNFKILLPPLKEQNQFGSTVEKIEILKEGFSNSLNEFYILFDSIKQRAFKGQLDIGKLTVLYEEQYSSSDNDRTKPEHFNKPINFESISVEIKKKIAYSNTNANVSIPDKKENNIETKEASSITDETDSLWRISKLLGKAEGIKFNDIEGQAVLKDIFSKRSHGFSFQEFTQFLKKEQFLFSYHQVKDFILNQLEENQLYQFYASKEWMQSGFMKADQNKDDFSGEGNIWFLVNNSST